MIVVDTNVIAAFWLKGTHTASARSAHRRNAVWLVPPVWRSEFRSVLRQHLLAGTISLSQARWFASKSEAMLHRHERPVKTADVLKLFEQSEHSTYDCEFVALAQALGVPLVTADRRLRQRFPETTVTPADFVSR